MSTIPASTAAIIASSLDYAQQLGQATVQATYRVTVRITRPQTDDYDRTSHSYLDATDLVIYEGLANVSELEGGQDYDLGGELIPSTSAQAQIPLSAGQIYRGDVLTILDTMLPSSQGRVFRIDSVGVGGAISVQQVLHMTGTAPSPSTPQT